MKYIIWFAIWICSFILTLLITFPVVFPSLSQYQRINLPDVYIYKLLVPEFTKNENKLHGFILNPNKLLTSIPFIGDENKTTLKLNLIIIL